MIGVQSYDIKANKIGEAFCDFCRIWDTKQYDKFGDLYIKTRKELGYDSGLSTEAKMLKMGITNHKGFQVLIDLIQNHVDEDIVFNGNKLIVTFGEAVAKVHIFKNPKYEEARGFGYTVSDYTGTPEYKENNMFIYLSTIVSGAHDDGKKLIKLLQKNCNVPILLEAGYIFNVDEERNPEYLDKLEEYYAGLGFKNINDRVGCYDTKIAMLWMPEKSVLDSVLKEAEEN